MKLQPPVSLYGQDLALADLAHSLAELLARGDDAWAAAPVNAARVLLARDTMLSATRTALHAVTVPKPLDSRRIRGRPLRPRSRRCGRPCTTSRRHHPT